MSRSQYAWYDPRRWPSLVVFAVAMVVVFFLSGIIVSIGIRLAGSLPAWQASLQAAAPALLVWQLVVYGGIAWLWRRHWKPRVIARLAEDKDGGEQARHKLHRLELVAAGFIIVLEAINVSKWLGGL